MKVTIEGIPKTGEINSIIKPLKGDDLQYANAEIEKNEVVFSPEKLTLHKAVGKSHAQGGTPVHLDNGNFIFSDYSKLAFTKSDVEQMEFKEGGSYKKSNYTPSKVLEREIPGGFKHHNKMVEVINNPHKHDFITKQSAELMMRKNLDKVGQVAFKQEEKKRFVDGAPDFSMGTAPVYDPNTNEEMIKARQYSPQSKFQRGGIFDEFQKKWGRFVPTGGKPYDPKNLPAGYNQEEYRRDLMKVMNEITGNNYSLDGSGMSQMRQDQAKFNSEFVNDAGNRNFWNRNATTDFNYVDKGRPFYDAIGVEKDGRQFGSQELMNNWIKSSGFQYINGSNSKGFYVDPTTGRYIGTEIRNLTPKLNTPNPGTLPPPIAPPTRKTPQGNPNPGIPTPEASTPNLPTVPTRYNVGLTPWQQINLGKGMADALGVKTYMPMRQQQQSVLTQPDLISAQPMINQANQAYTSAARLNRLLTNPQMATAANEQLAANRLENIDNIIGQVQNQNVGLINSSRERNATTLNNDAAANRAFDQRYYDQTTTALQNRDHEREFKWNQVMNDANAMFAENQAFNNALNSQQQYRTNIPITDRQGNITGYRSSLPYEPRKGFFGIGFQYQPNLNADALLNSNIGSTGANNGAAIQAEIARINEQLASETDGRSKAALANTKAALLKLLYGK